MPKLATLPADCTFPQLADVLDGPRFAARLQASLGPEFASRRVEIRRVDIERVYYKPGRSCRIHLVAALRGPDGRKAEQRWYAKIVPEPKPASVYRRALAGRLAPPEFGPAVAWIEDLGMVLWAYPNDPNLPGLPALVSREAVAERVRRDPGRFGLPPGELVLLRLGVGKYVPGQRCGYRYRLRWKTADREIDHRLYGKAYPQGAGRPAWEILRQLAASDACRSGRLRVPEPYAYDPELEIVWQEMLPGRAFSKEADLVSLSDRAGEVAASLAAFHATPLELGPGLGLEQEQDELEASARKIARAYPQHAARVETLRRRLLDAVPRLPEVPPAPVHGSFKTSHVFDAGGQVAFIDFDGAGRGDPTYDVGRFLAHLAVTALEPDADPALLDAAVARFRDGYAAGVPWGWPEPRVRWYTSALLVSSQAYKCVKRMAPARVEAILGAAESWFPAV